MFVAYYDSCALLSKKDQFINMSAPLVSVALSPPACANRFTAYESRLILVLVCFMKKQIHTDRAPLCVWAILIC